MKKREKKFFNGNLGMKRVTHRKYLFGIAALITYGVYSIFLSARMEDPTFTSFVEITDVVVETTEEILGQSEAEGSQVENVTLPAEPPPEISMKDKFENWKLRQSEEFAIKSKRNGKIRKRIQELKRIQEHPPGSELSELVKEYNKKEFIINPVYKGLTNADLVIVLFTFKRTEFLQYVLWTLSQVFFFFLTWINF